MVELVLMPNYRSFDHLRSSQYFSEILALTDFPSHDTPFYPFCQQMLLLSFN